MLFKTPPSSPGDHNALTQTQTQTTIPCSSASSSPSKVKLSISGVANIFVKMRRVQANSQRLNIEGSSGSEPQTHPVLHDSLTCEKKEKLELTDVFVCIGAVNVGMLLRATRVTLMDLAETLGANCLVDEQWRYVVHGPKSHPHGTYKVQVHYSASATRASRRDPHRPVALEQAKGVPGLMTIVKRYE